MRDITLSEATVDRLLVAARLGDTLLRDRLAQAEDRYERNNVAGQIRRTQDAIQDAEWQSMLAEFAPDAEQMSANAEKKRNTEDMFSNFSDDKANFIEGKR